MLKHVDEVLILCGSDLPKSTRVARKIQRLLKKTSRIETISRWEQKKIPKHFLIVCPTYGDEEPPLLMEDFLQNLNLKNQEYFLCELGNYFGYETFSFGASKIIRHYLKELGWNEIIPNLSLDTVPKIDWQQVEKWVSEVNDAIT